jgi:predicted nucleotidyltransferase
MVALDAQVERRALAAARALQKMGGLRRVYVFGSHVEGRATRWSDIDLAAFVDGVETWDLRRRAQVMARIQREAGLDVETHLFPASALAMPDRASFAAYVIQNGLRVWDEKSADA